MPSLQPGDLVFPPWKPTLRINDKENLMWYIFSGSRLTRLRFFFFFLIYEFNSSPNFAFRVEEASLKKRKKLREVIRCNSHFRNIQQAKQEKNIKQSNNVASNVSMDLGSKLAMGPRRP